MEQQITLDAVQTEIVAIKETQALILKILTKKEREEQKKQEDKDELASLAPIPNALAARLLRISTRQLQRKRHEWRLVWEERGRQVFYHVKPLINAIGKFHLNWCEDTLEKIKSSNKRLPRL